MSNPRFNVSYVVKGENSWEQRVYAQSRLSQDMKHGPTYTIEKYATKDGKVHFLVEVEDELALSSDYFRRAASVSRAA